MSQRCGRGSVGRLATIQRSKGILRGLAYFSIKGPWYAALKSQCRFILVHFLASILVFTNCSIAYADVSNIVPDSAASGNKVYMDTAANGLSVININDPNGVGVSHNKFLDYNVNSSGAIINNSQESAVSELGGVVLGNSNLHNSATTIINEVTSSSKSTINGPQEILGGKADYILANPNGISINGGEFINAHRATVTTGRVGLDSAGSLEKIYVEKGNIEFTDRDLDVSNLDYFDIIARTTELKVKIHGGRELRVITGKGEYDVKNDQFKSEAASSSAPSVTIDSSKLGGLYAGKIKLVSNEDGVGVNIPDIASSASDIEITSSGKIVHKNIRSSANIGLKSKNDGIVVTSGTKSSAAGNISYSAKEAITIEDGSVLVTSGNIELTSTKSKLDNKGKIIASGHSNVNILAHSVANKGTIIASYLGDVTIASTSSIANNGKLVSKGGKLAFIYKDDFGNSGTLYSKTGIKLDEGRTFKGEANSIIRTDGEIAITTSGDIENKGKIISAESSQFTAGGKFTNSGVVDSRDKIGVTSGLGSTNSGLLKATNNVLLNSTGDVVNSGVIFGENRSIKIHSVEGVIANTGKIVSPDLNLRAKGDISNSDLIEASVLQMVSDDGSLTNSNGSIKSATTATMKLAKDFINVEGLLLANDKIKITSSGGKIVSDKKSAIISKQEAIELDAVGNIVNAGHLEAAKDITLKSRDTAVNEGRILAGGVIDFDVTNGIGNNKAAKISATTTVKFKSGSYSNLGDVDARDGDIRFEVAGDMVNGGHILAAKNLTSRGIIGGKIINTGDMLAGVALDLSSRLGFENETDAHVEAGSRLTFRSEGHLTNKGLILSAADRIDLDFARDVVNEGNISSADLKIFGGDSFINVGSIIAKSLLEIEANNDIDNQLGGRLESGDNMTIHSQAGSVTNKGDIVADKQLKLEALDFVNNSGTLQSKDGIAVFSARSNIINDGSIVTKANAAVTSRQDFFNTGRVDSVGNIVINAGAKVGNSGELTARGSVNIGSVADFSNRKIIAGTSLAITSGGILSNTGLLLSGELSTLTADGDVQNIDSGIIDSSGMLTIASLRGKVANINSDPGTYDKGGIIAKSALLIKSALGVDNMANHIESSGKTEIETAGYFNNTGNIITAEALELRVDGAVSNSGEVQTIGTLSLRAMDGDSLAASIVNNGLISSKNVVDIAVRANIENNRAILARNAVRLTSTGGVFINKGLVSSTLKNIQADIEGNIDNDGGILESHGTILLTSKEGSLTNSGTIFSRQDKLSLLAKRGIDNKAGIISAPSDVTVNSSHGSVINRGKMSSENANLSIRASSGVLNYGLIQAAHGLKADIDRGDFTNEDGTILAGRELEITADKIENQSTKLTFGYLQGAEVNLTAREGGVLNNGYINSLGNGIIAASNGNIINSKNIQFAGNGIIEARVGTINSSGLIQSTELIRMMAAGKITNSGEVDTKHLEVSSRAEIENDHYIKATGKITFSNTPTIINSGLVEFGAMEATAGITNITNTVTTGKLKGRDLAITAVNFNNNGITELDGRLTLAVTNFTTNNLMAKGVSNITIAGSFTNSNYLQLTDTDLALTAHSIANAGRIKTRSFTGNATTGAFTNSGIIFGSNLVNVTAATGITNNPGGYFISGGAANLRATGGALTNSGGIYGGASVDIGAASITNSGVVNSQGSITATGSMSNSGTLAGQNALTINGALSNSGTMVSNTALNVNAGGGDITNTGSITSHGTATLNSRNLTNGNILQAVSMLTSTQSGSITNNHSIYGGIINLSANGGNIDNNSRIIARDAMVLYASTDVVNKQEISLLGTGTLSITAGRNTLNNLGYNITRINRSNLAAHIPTRVWEETGAEVNHGSYQRQRLLTLITKKSSYADTLVSVDPIIPVISSRGNISINAGVNLNNSGGVIAANNTINVIGTSLTNQDVLVHAHTYHEPRERSISRHKKKDWKGRTSWTQWGPAEAPLPSFFTEVPINTIPSLIQAGGAISGNLSGEVVNGSPESGGGRAAAITSSAIGTAVASNYAAGVAAPADGGSTISPYIPRFTPASTQSLASHQPVPSVPADTAIVKRGPLLAEISATRSIERRGITASSRLGRTALDTADISKLAMDIADTYISPTERSASGGFVDEEIQSKRGMGIGGGYISPSEQDVPMTFDDAEINETVKGSEWHKPEKPGKYYIKETSPVFADMSTYFSTDNFIKRIEGFEPKKQSSSQVHYGDSMKQMDIVRRQMIELTGLGFLDERVDYATEMRNLYESGIRYGKDMRLAPGIALSQAHVDRLQDDMVWAEEIELRGTRVIIPRLYLGKNKRGEKASGMLAREIDISAGSIVNTSSIVGQKVRLSSKGDIVNSGGGDIYASKALELSSLAGSIRNIGSSIGSGGSGMLKAAGNIENIRTSERVGDNRNYFTKVGKMAKMSVVGPLSLISGGDLLNRGSAISSGDLRFAVGGNFTNESVALDEGTNSSSKNYYHRTSSVAYKQGTIDAVGSVMGMVGGDFTLLGSRLGAGGDMSLNVGGNSYIATQIESQLVDSYSSHTTSGTFSDKEHVHSSQSVKEKLSAASLTSGGKLSLENRGEQVLVAAKLMGEGGLRLKGAKTSILASRLKEYSSEFRHDEGTWTNTTKSVGHDHAIHAHSELSGGVGTIEIQSERLSIDYTAPATKGRSVFGGSVVEKQPQAKPSWMRHLESRDGVVWNPLTNTDNSWHKSKTTMSKELTAVVGIAAGVATSWMGGWGMFAAPATTTATTATTGSVLSAMGTAAGHSLVIGASSTGSISMINSGLNGRVDLSQLGKDLTSKESLKSLGLSALTAGIGAGIGERLGGALDKNWGIATELTPGMDLSQRMGSLATQTAINSGVRTGLAGISGEDIGSIWKAESLSSTLAMGQSVIGDVGEKQKLAEGGLGKIAMHGTLGGLYSQAMGSSFTSGAIGGGVGELVAKPIIQSGGSSEIVKLVSAATMFGIGGSVGDIETSGKVGQSMVESNFLPHMLAVEAVIGVIEGLSAAEALIIGSSVVVAGGMVTMNYADLNSLDRNVSRFNIYDTGKPSILSTPMPKTAKPKVLSTPVVPSKPSILSTPAHIQDRPQVLATPTHELASWQKLPGYMPDLGPDMSVLYKDVGRAGKQKRLKELMSGSKATPYATPLKPTNIAYGEGFTKIHKNSHNYIGDTHVYRILDKEGKTYKIGESARGVRKDGRSIRAEQQARKLRYETGEKFETEIRRTFPSKKEAYEYENKLIKKFRETQGQDSLPGNKGNH